MQLAVSISHLLPSADHKPISGKWTLIRWTTFCDLFNQIKNQEQMNHLKISKHIEQKPESRSCWRSCKTHLPRSSGTILAWWLYCCSSLISLCTVHMCASLKKVTDVRRYQFHPFPLHSVDRNHASFGHPYCLTSGFSNIKIIS